MVPTEKSEKSSGTNKIIDNLRGLIGLHHFYTALISFIRKALYNDIGKCSNLKAEIYDFFLNLKLKVDVISNMYVDHLVSFISTSNLQNSSSSISCALRNF